MTGKETVYLKAEQSIELTKPDVTIGDAMTVECVNPVMLARIKTMKLLKIPQKGQHRYVVSIMRVIELIHQEYPEAEIQNIGAPDFIIAYEDQKTPNRFMHFLKTMFIVLLTFIGAAFSIMAFNNDVSTTKLFGQIYKLLTGAQNDGFTILEFTYSIGLIVGILVFFNHFGGKKFSVDPTPMEVEMRIYENEIQTALIQNYSREQEEVDIGKPNPKGRGGKKLMPGAVMQAALGLIGFATGVAAAGGLFSFIVGLGVISDFADRTHTGDKILLYEESVALGGILGNIFFIYEIHIPYGALLVPLVGLFSGIFVGCWSMALAEILNIFPIFVRRIKILKGLPYIVMGIAFGKGIGALIFFFNHW